MTEQKARGQVKCHLEIWFLGFAKMLRGKSLKAKQIRNKKQNKATTVLFWQYAGKDSQLSRTWLI